MKSTDKKSKETEFIEEISEKRRKMSLGQSKTSITLLQEICAKKNSKDMPIYTEVTETPDEYADQNMRFFIRCQALGLVACGGGVTKKLAKHTAAEKLLNKYLHPTAFDDDDDGISATPDANCISELMDFCVLKDYHKPLFDLVSSCGPSHAPTFTMECKLNSIIRRGTAGNKQQAKQLAAKEVLDILKTSYPDIEKKVSLVNGPNQVKDSVRQKVSSYLDLKKKDPFKIDKMGKMIKDRHKFFRSQDAEFVEIFVGLLSSTEFSDEEKYQKVVDELETMWPYEIKKLEETDLHKFELQIDFDKFTCFIIAGSEKELQSEVLKYFYEMMNINVAEPPLAQNINVDITIHPY